MREVNKIPAGTERKLAKGAIPGYLVFLIGLFLVWLNTRLSGTPARVAVVLGAICIFVGAVLVYIWRRKREFAKEEWYKRH